jgi:hypothetical protein
MTNWQWALVAIASVIAGMVVSRLLKPGGAQLPKSKRKDDD